MSSRNILNLSLLIFIVALTLALVFKPGKEEAAKEKLTSLKSSDITQVNITRNTTLAPITLTKQNNAWHMSSPFQVLANDFRVQSLLRLVETTSLARYATEGLDLTKYKLDKPQATITLNNNLKIEFGGTAALAQNRYVRIGEHIHLITDTFLYQLNTNATHFIHHALLPPSSKISYLALQDLTLELIEGQWQVTPKDETYSADAVTELINEWQLSQALELKAFAKDAPVQPTITLKLANNEEPIKFELVKSEDQFILARRDLGLKYIFPVENAERLLQLPQKEEIPEVTSPAPSAENTTK